MLDTDLLIRSESIPPVEVTVDINEYMTSGPGAFRQPGKLSGYRELLGGLRLQQYMYDDGKDNVVERAYIWNTTAFQIGGRSRPEPAKLELDQLESC